jgi:hypothetical protein
VTNAPETKTLDLEQIAQRLEKIAYALREDGRTADGVTKAGAAAALDRLTQQVREVPKTAWQWANLLEGGLRPEQHQELITFLREGPQRMMMLSQAHERLRVVVMTAISDPSLTWEAARIRLGEALRELAEER